MGSTRNADRVGFSGLKKVAVWFFSLQGAGSRPPGVERKRVKSTDARRQLIPERGGMVDQPKSAAFK